jgi:protein-disulfide isomerase
MAQRRRFAGFLLSLVALVLLAAPEAVRAEDKVGAQDVSLGAPKAPVTLIEYASVTCPHCGRFNADVYPALKARYIDTGKVRYIFREVPIHEQEDAAGFLIARCAGPQRYLVVTDALFHAQPLLFDKHDLHGWLMAGAAAAGLDEAQMRACISDVAAIEAFNARAEHTMTVDKVDSTPTVIVNGKPVEPKGPEFTIADIDAAVRPLLGGKSPGSARRPARAPIQ